VTIRRVLGLGTYPAVKPVHGGQRRVTAFRRFYETIGIEYVYACIYDGNHYAPPFVGPYDIPLDASRPADAPIALIGDWVSGQQGAMHAISFEHFRNVAEQLKPDALQLEQPFMWPLVRRLRETHGGGRLPLIYSSHNVEAPLKDAILSSGGVQSHVRRRIRESVEQMEADICRASAFIVCVSTVEREHYLQNHPSPQDVIVVPNGVDRPPAIIGDYAQIRAVFEGRPFMFMVGSAYSPNIDGFCDYVLRDGPFMMPPVKSLAVCGGMGDGIINHPSYQRFQAANSSRIQLFPRIEDSELWALMNSSHGALLPLGTGRGSNLKTAEALVLGKWVVATSVAMRGFEPFLDSEGLILADNSVAFRQAIATALRSPPLVISEQSKKAREALHWDRCFGDSDLKRCLSRL
jgi:glycosyltransferase involved in cell wall biosynthesis